MLTVNHDRLFKELITELFYEFLEEFAPNVAREIDRDQLEFLDKETFGDVVSGERHEVDIIVKVKLSGQGSVVLVHVENQATAQPNFSRRMFHYYAELDRKFGLPVYPIAVLSYDFPLREEPNIYERRLFGKTVERFEFHVVQLNRLNWREYLGSANPAAIALMAKMQFGKEDRVRVRAESLRLFLTLKLNPRRRSVIDKFVRSYLKLTSQEMNEVLTKIRTDYPEVQEEQYLEVMNEWEERGISQGISQGIEQGISQGIEQGILQGLHEGQVRMVSRLIQTKFGSLSQEIGGKLESLSSDQLELLADAILSLNSEEGLTSWLDSIQGKS